ncbi:MAG TPA: nucleotidyltransferase domain-containing protein, partial [Thermosynergistes sp.]|nr:nucleotidyltransferase domain-containing protein [Thermosynergistes sp.]
MQRLKGICADHDVILVYLFGSQAEAGFRLLEGRNEVPSDQLADLDVGVVTAKPLPPPGQRAKLYSDLYNELEEVFKPFRLDLVFLEEHHSVFQFEAIKGICA